MKKKVLITGITGLIGSSVFEKLQLYSHDYQFISIVRPGTKQSRLDRFINLTEFVYLDLNDIENLKKFLATNRYDFILHIAALRGGRTLSRSQFYSTNVQATEQIAEYALKNDSRLVYCSSVGVFGAIPEEVPANNETAFKADNYYHYTKILSEKIINILVLRGLNAVIVRPSITYGINDRGFPYQLVRLIKNKSFPLSNRHIWIHLGNIDTISSAIVHLVTEKTTIVGKSFNIADVEPIQIFDLVNFINRQLTGKNYPRWLTVDNSLLSLGAKITGVFRNELWKSRFELISKSWFYDVSDAYALLNLPQHFTIPDFNIVVEDYRTS